MLLLVQTMENNSTNGSTLEKIDDIIYSLSLLEWIVNVFFAFVGSATLSLNVIVIAGFVKEKRVREMPGNVFILNLAISDSLTGSFVCYIAVLNMYGYQNDFEYLFRMGFMGAFLVASSFFLNFLTVDRYLKVTMHMRYLALMTTRKHLMICCVTWLICIVLGILPLLGWHRPVVKSLSFFETFSSSYVIFVFSLGMVPVFCMIYTYSRLYFVSLRHRQQISSQGQSREGVIQVRKTRAVVKSIFLLIGAYLVCWLPFGLYSLFGAAMGRDPNNSSFPVFTLLVIMGFINSLLNPLIYASKVEEIRQFYKKICCWCRKSAAIQNPDFSVGASTRQSQTP